MCPDEVPQVYSGREERILLIAESHLRLTGRALVDGGGDVVAALWNAPDAILAHGTEPDPLFFFANAKALAAFEYELDELLGLPSSMSAEEMVREERQALLDKVTAQGFIDDYAGVRIASSGRRFRIAQATVWNLIDEVGVRHGQAATFQV